MKLVIKIEKKLIIKTSIKIHHQNHMNSLAESRENNYYDKWSLGEEQTQW